MNLIFSSISPDSTSRSFNQTLCVTPPSSIQLMLLSLAKQLSVSGITFLNIVAPNETPRALLNLAAETIGLRLSLACPILSSDLNRSLSNTSCGKNTNFRLFRVILRRVCYLFQQKDKESVLPFRNEKQSSIVIISFHILQFQKKNRITSNIEYDRIELKGMNNQEFFFLFPVIKWYSDNTNMRWPSLASKTICTFSLSTISLMVAYSQNITTWCRQSSRPSGIYRFEVMQLWKRNKWTSNRKTKIVTGSNSMNTESRSQNWWAESYKCQILNRVGEGEA